MLTTFIIGCANDEPSDPLGRMLFEVLIEVVDADTAASDCKDTVGIFELPIGAPLDGLRWRMTGFGGYPALATEADEIGIVADLLAVVVRDFSGVFFPKDFSVEGVERDGLNEFINVLFNARGEGLV